MDIRTELQAVIDKSLPSLEAQRLRAYIEEAERGKEELARVKQENERVSAALKAEQVAKQAVLAQLADAHREIAAFRTREAAFAQSERDVMVAQFRADKADAVRDAVVGVVGQFTKNPEIRRQTWDNKSTPIYSQPQYAGAAPMQSGTSMESRSGNTTETSE